MTKEQYHKEVMLKRMKDLINDGRCRVQITLIDDTYKNVDCSQEVGKEIFTLNMVKRLYEILENEEIIKEIW